MNKLFPYKPWEKYYAKALCSNFTDKIVHSINLSILLWIIYFSRCQYMIE